MLKYYYKTAALSDQISVRNKEKCDGVEIQMLGINEDFRDLKDLEHPIHTIHLPYANKECNLDQVINGEFINQFYNILQVAQKHKAGIVLHLENNLEQVKCFTFYKIEWFLNLLKQFPDVKVAIENTSLYDNIDGFKEDTIMDVPKVCNYLNELIGEVRFYPLLDICHLLTFINGFIEGKPYTIKSVIDAYKSDWFNIHLNYACGIGQKKFHGINFDSNPLLYNQLIRYLDSLEAETNLILEVFETDYLSVDNARKMINDAKEIVNGRELPIF